MSRVFSGHQPNFLPYMGYFYKIFKSDVFVLDDDVQYSNGKGALHNTNFIKVNGSRFRITVPVSYAFGDPINTVKICYEKKWDRKLLAMFTMNYSKAPHFAEGYDLVERHLAAHHERLVDLNISLLHEICQRFGISSEIVLASRDCPTDLVRNERNVFQCLALGGDVYYSGIGGKLYNDEEMYRKNGIELIYTDYVPPVYKQVGPGFVENLSVIDYIFCQGFELPKEWTR